MNSIRRQAAVPAKALAWERRDDESAPAFIAFSVYRDLGPTRSIDAAWRTTQTGQNRGKRAPSAWEGWSSRFDWVERAAAYDAHIERIGLEARQKALRAATEADTKRRIQNARATQGAGFKLIEKAKLEEITALEARKMLKEAAKLIEVGAKNELLELARAGDEQRTQAATTEPGLIDDETELMRRLSMGGMGATEGRYG